MSGTPVTSTGTVVIDADACKGCDLCIDACPVDVLTMTTDEVNLRGYPFPQLQAGCIGCKACSQICPDFVFQVYRFETPVTHTAGPEQDGPAMNGPEQNGVTA